MRSVFIVLALCGTAAADDGDDDLDTSKGVSFVAQAARYADQPNRNMGVGIEFSVDYKRWQYLFEGTVAGVSFGKDFGDGLEGTMYRGGLGVRYIARKFHVRNFDTELGFELIAAVQNIEWEDDDNDVRPELGLGFSWNFIFFETIGFRTSLRVAWTRTPGVGTMTCPGSMACGDDRITAGFMLVTGLTW